MDCLDEIIGLSTNECPCYSNEEMTINPSASKSGYYIDDKSDGIPLHYIASGVECGTDSVWELMETARKDAIVEFRKLIGQYVYEYNVMKETPQMFQIGDQKVNAYIQPLKKWVGTKITPAASNQGATLVITKLEWDVLNDTPIGFKVILNGNEKIENTVTPVNGKASFSIPQGLQIQLVDDYGNANELYIISDMEGNEFRNIKYNCNCNGSIKHNWEHKLIGKGVHGDTINDLSNSPYSDMTGGIRIFATYRCEDEHWLCKLPLYEHTPFFRVMAKNIQLLAINKLIGHILTSGRINTYTTLKREDLINKARNNTSKIKNDITWMAINLPQGLNMCIECKDSRKTRIHTILV